MTFTKTLLGQGPRPLRRRRRVAADGRVRPDVGVRRRDGRAVPDKGRVLTAMSAFWFDHLRRHRPEPPASRLVATTGAPARLGGADDARAARRDAADRVHRARATSRARRGRSTGPTGPCTARRCPRGLQESERLPEPCSRRRPRRRAAARREHLLRRRRRRSSAARSPSRRASDQPRACTRRAPRGPPSGGIILADTKFELGFVDGELVVADEVLTPDSSRFWPADEWKPGITPPSFDKQPVRDYLEARAGTSARRPRRCPPRSSRRPAAATSRPTSASPAGRFADWPGATCRRYDTVTPRCGSRCSSRCGSGPASPIRRARRSSGRCRRSGFDGVHEVRGRQGDPLRPRRRRRGAPPAREVDELCAALPHQPGDRGRRS